MPGSVVNLSIARSQIPDPIVVDTNLVVEYLVAPFLSVIPRYVAVQAQRANQFFRDLAARGGTGIVTPTTFDEIIHIAIRFIYQQERLRLGASARQAYGVPINNWLDLYKQDAEILQSSRTNLDQLRQLLVASDLVLLAPDELGPIPSGRRYDKELIHLVGTYGLDSNDAAILMEAQRCGVTDIATLDADMQRAQQDFNIYTWL